MVNYRRLGKSELRVSVTGFGTAQLRLVPEHHALEALRAAFDLGVNLVHTAPDYEGSIELVARTIRECGKKDRIHVLSQGWGPPEVFERFFEQTCEALGTRRLDLFGIASIYDREQLGDNVWGQGGQVDFLLRKKREGRLGGLFFTSHGPPWHIEQTLRKGVFDACMVAWNALGFHLLSYNPRNLWDFADPRESHPSSWRFENLPALAGDVFPCLAQEDIGLLLMKPFAGGLVIPSRAFPPRLDTDSGGVTAADIIRTLLSHEVVSSVVAGTASAEEASENARAGCGNLSLDEGSRARLARHIENLKARLCSRCGRCDGLCSRGLPVSWLFRAAYIALYPAAIFETWDAVDYFRLHPHEEPPCSGCKSRTCSCPAGLDIPLLLEKHHQCMMSMRAEGICGFLHHGSDNAGQVPGYRARVTVRDVPRRVGAADVFIVRLALVNAGSQVWPDGGSGGGPVLRVSLGDQPPQSLHLRKTVAPGERAHFVAELRAGDRRGEEELRLLFEVGGASGSGGTTMLDLRSAIAIL